VAHRVAALNATECWRNAIQEIQVLSLTNSVQEIIFPNKPVLELFGLSHPHMIQILQTMLEHAYSILSRPISESSRKRRRRVSSKFYGFSTKRPTLTRRSTDNSSENSNSQNGRNKVRNVSSPPSTISTITTTLHESEPPTQNPTDIVTTENDSGYHPYINFALLFNFLKSGVQ